MTDDSSSWPREGSLAEIDFHTPTSTLGSTSSRIRRNPSGRFEAMPPLREPARGLPSPGTLPPFAPLPVDELPRRKRDSGAFRPAAARPEQVPPRPDPSSANLTPEPQLVTTTVVLPQQGWLVPALLGAGIMAAAGLVLWLLLR